MPVISQVMKKPQTEYEKIMLGKVKKNDNVHYTKIEKYLTQLSSDGIDKTAVAKDAKKTVNRIAVLSKQEKDLLNSYIDSFHNG
ncbi:MAG: hypothetical protein LUE12_03520 [Ruminococcus sp.]|nr:hypothetical protein [Ruminococcus sp.]